MERSAGQAVQAELYAHALPRQSGMGALDDFKVEGGFLRIAEVDQKYALAILHALQCGGVADGRSGRLRREQRGEKQHAKNQYPLEGHFIFPVWLWFMPLRL